MLTELQRSTIFALFCFATLVLIGLEFYCAFAMITDGFSGGKAVAAVLSSGLLAGCGVSFLKLFKANFLKTDVLPMGRLHRLATERSGIVEDARRSGQNTYDTRQSLVNNTLRFAEETLRGWLPGSHFELCVFVDADQPLLFSYFDSHHDTVARSMKMRASNPLFYLEKGYEVTKVLRDPTSHPRVIGDTQDAKTNYIFTTDEQRKQLRSTLLLSLDLTAPCALVVSSNAKDAMPETNHQLMSFIRYTGEIIRGDLLEGGFIYDIRKAKPELFPLRLEHTQIAIQAPTTV